MEYLIERPKHSPNKYKNKNIIYISPVLSIIAGISSTLIISLILTQIF